MHFFYFTSDKCLYAGMCVLHIKKKRAYALDLLFYLCRESELPWLLKDIFHVWLCLRIFSMFDSMTAFVGVCLVKSWILWNGNDTVRLSDKIFANGTLAFLMLKTFLVTKLADFRKSDFSLAEQMNKCFHCHLCICMVVLRCYGM